MIGFDRLEFLFQFEIGVCFFLIFCFEQHQTYSINVTYIGTPSFLMGIFDIEVMSFVRPKVTANFALIAGSSRHGKALLASVG